MKRKLLEEIYDKGFVPVLIGSLSFIGYMLYTQGGADTVHKLYKKDAIKPMDEWKEK